LVQEVETLLPFRNENALQTVGYKEIIEYLDKNISLESAIEQIKQNTRKYAKRQMTWFRKDKELRWFHPDEVNKMLHYIDDTPSTGSNQLSI
jgi:tRNA dimethylallyltransferase